GGAGDLVVDVDAGTGGVDVDLHSLDLALDDVLDVADGLGGGEVDVHNRGAARRAEAERDGAERDGDAGEGRNGAEERELRVDVLAEGAGRGERALGEAEVRAGGAGGGVGEGEIRIRRAADDVDLERAVLDGDAAGAEDGDGVGGFVLMDGGGE